MMSMKAAAEQTLPAMRVRARKLAAVGRLAQEDADRMIAKIDDLESDILNTQETTDEKERREF